MFRSIMSLIIIMLFLTSCVNDNELKKYTVSLSVIDNSNSKNENQLTHYIRESVHYNPEITVKQLLDKESIYRLYFFVDYEKIKVTYENNEVDYIDLKLSEEDIKKLKVQFPQLSKGSHDILIIASRNPDLILDKKQIITFPNLYIQRRLRLVVENNTPKKMDLFKSEDFRSVASNQIMPFLSANPNAEISNMESLIPKSNLHTMWFNFGTGSYSSYAIVALSDNKQININKFIEVQPHTQVSIPVKQIINTQGLNKDLILCIVPSPYQQLEDDKGNIADIDFPRFLNKITIE